jgi:hypothetical protein
MHACMHARMDGCMHACMYVICLELKILEYQSLPSKVFPVGYGIID